MRNQEYELLFKNISTSEFHRRLRNATAQFTGIHAMDAVDKYLYGEAPGKFWIDYVPDITMNFDTSGNCPTTLLGSVYVQDKDLLVRYTFTKKKPHSLLAVMGIVMAAIFGLEGAWDILLSFFGQGEGAFFGSCFFLGGILIFLLAFDQIRIRESQKIKLVNFLKEAVGR